MFLHNTSRTTRRRLFYNEMNNSVRKFHFKNLHDKTWKVINTSSPNLGWVLFLSWIKTRTDSLMRNDTAHQHKRRAHKLHWKVNYGSGRKTSIPLLLWQTIQRCGSMWQLCELNRKQITSREYNILGKI